MCKHETQFSPDRVYRYTLWRDWPMLDGLERQGFGRDRAYAMFIGLNPSTADETKDDPTIRRCIRFAKDWGYGALCMTNLFAFRATDPKVMEAAKDPVGPDNDVWLVKESLKAGVVIAAWGTRSGNRGKDVFQLLERDVYCLGKTKEGHPRHPLYVRADTLAEVCWSAPHPTRVSGEGEREDKSE